MIQRCIKQLRGASNPIMIKTLYQGIHSRAFLCAFWSLLFVALLGYTLCYLGSRQNVAGLTVFIYSTAGKDMFKVFSILLGFMTVFLIPFMTFLSLHNEVNSRALELVQITGLSPGRLVRGNLWAAAVQIALVYSLIAPFAVSCFIFGGIGTVHVLLVFGTLLLMAPASCVVAIFFGSLTAYPGFKNLARLSFLLVMACGLIAFFVGGIEFYDDLLRRPPEPAEALLGFGYALGMGLLAALFLMAASANALTFPHSRTSARTKAVALLIVIALFLAFILNGLIDGWRSADLAVAFNASLSCLFIAPCCLGWIVSDFHVTHAQRVRLGTRGRVRRLLFFPFLNGTFSTAIYLAICTGLAGLGSYGIAWLADNPLQGRVFLFKALVMESLLYPPLLSFTYVLYLSALAGMAARLLPPKFQTATARRIVLMVVICLSTLPVTISAIAFDTMEHMTSLPMALFPGTYVIAFFVGSEHIWGSGLTGLRLILMHMALPLLIGLLFHAKRAVAEVRLCRRLLHGEPEPVMTESSGIVEGAP